MEPFESQLCDASTCWQHGSDICPYRYIDDDGQGVCCNHEEILTV